MSLGIILVALFVLIAAGILILIFGMLVLGFKRISKMGKSDKKQTPVKPNEENPAQAAKPQELSPTTGDNSTQNPPQK